MKYNKFLPYILFTSFFIILLMPLLTGQYYPKWDASDGAYPAFTYLADSVREGRFPLWDPYTNCGYPLHADPGFFTTSIPAILLGITLDNAATGFVLFWFIYWCWAGLGMIWLSRDFGASNRGAFLRGACLFIIRFLYRTCRAYRIYFNRRLVPVDNRPG